MRFMTVTTGFTKKKKKIMAVLCGMAMAAAPYGMNTGFAASAAAPAAAVTASAGAQTAAETTAAVSAEKAEAAATGTTDKDAAGVKAEEKDTAAEKAGEPAAVKPADAKSSLDTAFDHLAEDACSCALSD